MLTDFGVLYKSLIFSNTFGCLLHRVNAMPVGAYTQEKDYWPGPDASLESQQLEAEEGQCW